MDRFFDKIVLSNPGTMLVSKEELRKVGIVSVAIRLSKKCSYLLALVKKEEVGLA